MLVPILLALAVQNPPAPTPRPPRAPIRAGLPAVSPDGRLVAFLAPPTDSAQQQDLFVLDLASRTARRLTDTPEFEGVATWTPDSRSVAYSIRDRGTRQARSWLLDLATGARRPMLDSASVGGPAFSPDGAWLLYETGVFPASAINVAPAAGGPARVVSNVPGMSFWARWSPDGRRIAFITLDRGSNPPATMRMRLHVVNADGSGLAVVGDSTLRPETPAWSRDGQWIAFQMRRDDNYDVYVIRPDGSGLRRLTTEPSTDETPDWLADGRIVFQSDRRGAMELWTMHADGSNPTILFPVETRR